MLSKIWGWIKIAAFIWCGYTGGVLGVLSVALVLCGQWSLIKLIDILLTDKEEFDKAQRMYIRAKVSEQWGDRLTRRS